MLLEISYESPYVLQVSELQDVPVARRARGPSEHLPRPLSLLTKAAHGGSVRDPCSKFFTFACESGS